MGPVHTHEISRTPQLRLRLVYGFLAFITLLFLLGIVALSIFWDVYELRQNFERKTEGYHTYLRDKFTKNEALLTGFGAFIQGSEHISMSAANAYSMAMITRYPQVTMFQIAQYVRAENIGQFQRFLLDQGVTHPEIMNELGQRTPAPEYLRNKTNALPVIFMAPLAEGQGVLGLDLKTIDFVNRALPGINELQEKALYLSDPFELFDGEQALVMASYIKKAPEDFVAILVVKLADLIPSELTTTPNLAIDITLANKDRPQQLLYRRQDLQNQQLFSLYKFSSSETFTIADYKINAQLLKTVRWSEINWLKSIGILVFTACVVMFILIMHRLHSLLEVRQEEQRKKLFEQANHDALTGLINRAAFEVQARDVLQQLLPTQLHAACYFIDLSGFKQVNDIHGHHAGDSVLVAAAQALHAILRPSDIAARLGGDEFVIMVPGIKDMESLLMVLNKLRLALNTMQIKGIPAGVISASIGFAYTAIHGFDYKTLISAADSSMYGDKQNHYRSQTQLA